MRYIKPYKFHESFEIGDFDRFKSELNELLGNLTDDGFQVIPILNYTGMGITIYKSCKSFTSSIINTTPNFKLVDANSFNYGEIRPEIERMISYISNRYTFRDVRITKSINEVEYKRELPNEEDDNMRILCIEIKFLDK